MKSLIRLELQKQSKTFLGLLFIIAICLTLVTTSVSTFQALSFRETFLTITVMLQAFGIPFFALFLGGGAGAALRSAERNAEEDIPVRPTKRVFAAYVVSLTFLMLLAGILFAVSTPMKFSASLQKYFQVPLMMVVLLPLHSSAFVLSYWLSQGLLGSVVAAIITIVPTYFFFPIWFSAGDIDFGLISFTAVPGLIATSIHLSIILWLANTIERFKRRLLPTKIAIAATLVGALLFGVWGIFFVLSDSDFLDDLRHYEFREE